MIKKCLQIGFLLIGSPLLLAQVEKPSEIFWKNLEKHCGKAYEGKLAEHITRDDFTGKKLTMHVKSCSSNEIKIPFNVGDNYSRTWILTKKDGIITLKHDHRHENGTSETITFYGGTNTNFGFKDFQMFPADLETANLIDYASTNIWWITLDDTTFSYNLQKAGSKTPFHVYFDLTKEITIPPAPWGWGTPR
ncbi:hypothetical protein F0358_02770 [Empedobacter brevis]|uniref:hypothetical protein n=1 Tax=Empedobacter brevis TaxID=247 RepID=UPI00123CBC99|nr:hypothetical protein [Empedobacter brevis]QES91715.1 hypothetical protein F0358_02770 [Empedobacter brevis]